MTDQTNIEPYVPEKWLWTEADFEQMGWHDAHVYGFAAAFETKELIFDLDYIFLWVEPIAPARAYSFWVAPCTLVFENVSDVHINVSYDYWNEWQGQGYQMGAPDKIQHIYREQEKVSSEGIKSWKYTLSGLDIELRASGYKQYVRSQPVYGGQQRIDYKQRGGLSFSRTTPEGMTNNGQE